LKSSLEYAFVLAEQGYIEPEHLPQNILEPDAPVTETTPVATEAQEQKQQLVRALRQAGGNKSETARILGINRVTVMNRMRKYGIDLKKVVED
jgi:transcriptional regulator of acetoin/glycerol metabolism